MTERRHTADSITDDALDALYENAGRGWRRGDRWKERALKAEAAIERARALAERWENALTPDLRYARALRAVLAEPEEDSTP